MFSKQNVIYFSFTKSENKRAEQVLFGELVLVKGREEVGKGVGG
jgi:hypothetical protein